MFVDEAKISARIVHPNVVQVFEFAFHEESHYIVMEPVDGVDMARLLRRLEQRDEVAPATFVAELGRQVCRGLDFAHTLTDVDGRPLGIVHRDVTPPNIMVGWNGTVKILDFGLARAVHELRTNLTEAGTLKGKMSYVAPEQLEGQPADARSDVFSLGVVLHELLSGRRLFVGESDLETLRMVREMPVPRPSLRNPAVKPALEAAVMRALARDPEPALPQRRRDGRRARRRGAAQALLDAGVRARRPGAVPRLGGGGRGAGGGAADRRRWIVGRGRRERPCAAARAPSPAATGDRGARAHAGARSPGSRRRLPTAALAALAVLVLLRQTPAPAARTPPPEPRQPFSTVEVALDSTPQGAVVTADATRPARRRAGSVRRRWSCACRAARRRWR